MELNCLYEKRFCNSHNQSREFFFSPTIRCMKTIELPRTQLVQDGDGLCIKINARPNDPGVRVSAQQLDNWCVKQYRENIMQPIEPMKVEGAA